ncbi:CNNM domain-containing protein [Corynebacterium ulceribovis]|uniref:hemolysin family protein n=1 Tax=Corynebacterium ulceribovis TaxID=487732 RepID=UPI000375F708
MVVDLGMLAAVVVLLTLASMINITETAVSYVARTRVEELHNTGHSGARSLLNVLDHRAQHVNLLVLLRTLCEVSSAVLVTALAIDAIDSYPWAIVAAIVSMTLVSYVGLGVVARTLGRQNPYTISMRAAIVLSGLAQLIGPISGLLIRVGSVVTPGGGFRDGPFATEIELREMVDIAQERGIVESDERRMIQSVFDLASTTARTVMVPRPEMVWIESTRHAGQATALCVRSGHSRIPVIGESVDDVLGVIYLKDLVQQTYNLTDGGRSVNVTEVMRPAVFVPDSKNLDDLLQDMQVERFHIAMLVDEYGGIAGLVSIEDILEEIVGEIVDEYDLTETAPIEDLEDGSFRVVTKLSLEELIEFWEDRYGENLVFPEDVTDEVDTVGGLLAYGLGRVPLPGSEVRFAGLSFVAEGHRNRRGRMRVTHALVTAHPDPSPEIFDGEHEDRND